jgi:hypothetical protein
MNKRYNAVDAVLADMLADDNGADRDDNNLDPWQDSDNEAFGGIGLTDFDPDAPQDKCDSDEADEWLQRRAA